MATKGNRKDSCGDGNVLHLININILYVIFYYGFTRYYHQQKLGKRYRESLSILFLPIACESTIISK